MQLLLAGWLAGRLLPMMGLHCEHQNHQTRLDYVREVPLLLSECWLALLNRSIWHISQCLGHAPTNGLCHHASSPAKALADLPVET